MNEHKHTPGPWSAEKCRSGFAVYAYKSGEAVVQTEDDEGRYGTIANEANARMIAAAPELLDALRLVLAHDGALTGADWTAIRAAIAKAEGEG